jgi:hypothetical protein
VAVPVKGCGVAVLFSLAMAFTGLYGAFGGLLWLTAAGFWLWWALAVRAAVRDYRRALAVDSRPEPPELPWRLPVTPRELAAIDGDADLKAAVWATPAREEAL